MLDLLELLRGQYIIYAPARPVEVLIRINRDSNGSIYIALGQGVQGIKIGVFSQ
jgi:hypothetical protein